MQRQQHARTLFSELLATALRGQTCRLDHNEPESYQCYGCTWILGSTSSSSYSVSSSDRCSFSKWSILEVKDRCHSRTKTQRDHRHICLSRSPHVRFTSLTNVPGLNVFFFLQGGFSEEEHPGLYPPGPGSSCVSPRSALPPH